MHGNAPPHVAKVKDRQTSNLREWYERQVTEPTLMALEGFQERNSGLALSRILDLMVNRYNLMRAGCYVKSPRDITTKKAVINMQSIDNDCFAWPLCTLQKEIRTKQESSALRRF